MKRKNFRALVALLLTQSMLLSACGTSNGNADVTPAPDADNSATPTTAANASTTYTSPFADVYDEEGYLVLDDYEHGIARTEYNDNLDLSDYPLTSNDVADDFMIHIEAEDGILGENVIAYEDESFSGGSYVNGQGQGEESYISFEIELDDTGFYKINVPGRCEGEGRTDYLYIDGESAGYIVCNSNSQLVDNILDNLYLEAGTHTISLVPYWGYIDYDYFEISKSTTITEDTYNVTCSLSNPNADERTVMLYNFLCDIYGKYSLTGNYADKGVISLEYAAIEEATSENFAVLGLDMSAYGLYSEENGTTGSSIEYAYDWYIDHGGIVQMCWHWTSPALYVPSGKNWYSSFYKESSSIDLDDIMNGKDEAGYEMLMADIDKIATELEVLRDAGVPVIWRPLHEASGGWFWWGDCEPESYIALYRTMYDKMTNEHNLTNLIWMWNGQNPNWYPGDDVVDIVAYDIYAGEHDYNSYSATFAESVTTPTETKLVALSENGTVMDPDLVMRDNARWLFWGTWAEPYTLGDGINLTEQYTEKDMLVKAYESERILTLDELPDLKHYNQ